MHFGLDVGHIVIQNIEYIMAFMFVCANVCKTNKKMSCKTQGKYFTLFPKGEMAEYEF